MTKIYLAENFLEADQIISDGLWIFPSCWGCAPASPP